MFLEQFVDLFERQTSRLGDEEVYVRKTGEVEAPPKECNFRSQISPAWLRVHHVGCHKRKQPIPEPRLV